MFDGTDKKPIDKMIELSEDLGLYNEQIIIDTNKYFAEIIDEGGGTIGYNVVFPEDLLTEIVKRVDSLKQECEALKSERFALESLITDQENEIDELRQECEELKEEIEALEKINRRNDQELLRRLTYASNAERQRDRYRRALEEIEEIAKSFNINGLCFYNEMDDCSCCDMGADCNYLRRAKILYIINKAKGKGDD